MPSDCTHSEAHLSYRITGDAVLRCCSWCGLVQVTATPQPPAVLWAMTGRLDQLEYVDGLAEDYAAWAALEAA